MYPPIRVLVFVALLSLPIAAQTQVVSQDVVQLGTKTVRIPPPDGFVATFGRFFRFRDRFLSGQNPGTSVVEVHVPASLTVDLEKNEDISLSFYSGVGIPDASRVKDSTVAEFRSLVSDFGKQHDTLFAAKGPAVLDAAARLRHGLDKDHEMRTGLKMDEPTSLGYFQREPKLFSGMILQPIDRIALLIAFSFLHLKDRIIYVQFYRKFTDENDPAILRDSMTKWTTAILAANK